MNSRFDFNNDEKQNTKNKSSKKSSTKQKNDTKKAVKSKKTSEQSTNDKYAHKSRYVSDTKPVSTKKDKEEKSNILLFPMPKKISFKIFAYLIVLLVIAYLVFFVSKSISGKNISTYQVKEGSLTEQNTFTGIILRDETIYTSAKSGYFNYYLKEGEKASKTDLVYSIDSTGKIKDMLISDAEEATTLTEDDLKEVQTEIVKFSKTYDSNDYSYVYDFKDDLNSISLKMSNLFILDIAGNSVDKYYCGNNYNASSEDSNQTGKSNTGYVVYYYDGYEDYTPEQINSSVFNNEYEKHMNTNNQLISEGDFAYKLISTNNWKLVFKINDEQANEYNNKEIKVKFTHNQEVVSGKVSVIDVESPKKNTSVEHMCVVSFNNSIADFLNNRFVDFEISTSENEGYKVPKSSIAQKEFLLVPANIGYDFNSTTNKVCVKLDKYLEDGTKTYVTTELNVYDIDNDYYYVDNSIISKDTYVFGEDEVTSERITKSGTLTGVYRINQGFADFKKIKVLYENDEYCIIDPATTTIKPYDYIALNAKKIKDNEYIYE